MSRCVRDWISIRAASRLARGRRGEAEDEGGRGRGTARTRNAQAEQPEQEPQLHGEPARHRRVVQEEDHLLEERVRRLSPPDHLEEVRVGRRDPLCARRDERHAAAAAEDAAHGRRRRWARGGSGRRRRGGGGGGGPTPTSSASQRLEIEQPGDEPVKEVDEAQLRSTGGSLLRSAGQESPARSERRRRTDGRLAAADPQPSLETRLDARAQVSEATKIAGTGDSGKGT